VRECVPPQTFIRPPEKVRAEKDLVALALAAKLPGVRMPNLGLSEIDAADLISYIAAQTSRLADGAQHAPAGQPQHHQHRPAPQTGAGPQRTAARPSGRRKNCKNYD
jgi:hypothetical protein